MWPLALMSFPLVVREHAEPALERASGHAIARGQTSAQMVSVHGDVVTVENEIALQGNEDRLILQVRVGKIGVMALAAGIDGEYGYAVMLDVRRLAIGDEIEILITAAEL